eukprot:jgi/Pico_ML_1/52350/g3065.t1
MHRLSSGEVKFTSLTDAVDVRTREAPRTSAMAFLLARRWRPLASLVSRGTCLGREAATWDGGMPVAMGNALSDVWKRGFTNVVQGAIPSQGVLALNQLWDNPGSMKKVRLGGSETGRSDEASADFRGRPGKCRANVWDVGLVQAKGRPVDVDTKDKKRDQVGSRN